MTFSCIDCCEKEGNENVCQHKSYVEQGLVEKIVRIIKRSKS